MKKILLLIIGLSMVFGLQNCIKKYNEFGEDSIFYYLNGSPIVPTCPTMYTTNKTRVFLSNDTLRVHICGEVQIDYVINHYQGKGRYLINDATTNTCNITEYNSLFQAINNNQTYMNVLELDTIAKHFSAVFEADLVDATHHHLKITKGRMDVKYDY